MAGAQLTMSVDDEEVQRAVRELARRSLNMQEPFEEIGSMLVSSTRQRIEDEETPGGEAWPELAKSTQRGFVSPASKTQDGKRKRRSSRARRRGSEHILRVRGHLYNSLTYLATTTDVAVGTNRVYAALQQFGGKDDMTNPGAAAVPARPFLGLSSEDQTEISRILVDHLGEAAR